MFFPPQAEGGRLARLVGLLSVFCSFLVTAFFLGGLFYWSFHGGFTSSSFEPARRLALRFYGLTVFLFVLQLLHAFAAGPFFHSLVVEFALITAAAVPLLLIDHNLYLKRIEKELEEQNALQCPSCRKKIDRFYRICPMCNCALEGAAPKVKVTA